MNIKTKNIKDIAKIANVSPATVSRVINNSANVDNEKKQRVLDVISETGFIPNQIARSLYKKSSNIIGYIVPNIINPFFNEIGRYMEDVAFERNYKVILCNSDGNITKEIEYMDILYSMNADGIIIITNNTKTEHNIKIPFVIIDRDFEYKNENISVKSNHYDGGKKAANHLLDIGCKNIVCMGISQGVSSAVLRYKAYIDFCKENNIKEKFIECDYSFEDGIIKAKYLLQKYPEVDGIIASNDISAMAVYRVLTKNKIKVPEQVKLIGFDNIGVSSLVTPALTTIGQPIMEIAKRAANMIIDIIEGEEVTKKSITLPVTLIKRDTT